jgi:hypothetical protein
MMMAAAARLDDPAKLLNPLDIKSYFPEKIGAEVKWYDQFSCGQILWPFTLWLHRISDRFPAN